MTVRFLTENSQRYFVYAIKGDRLLATIVLGKAAVRFLRSNYSRTFNRFYVREI